MAAPLRRKDLCNVFPSAHTSLRAMVIGSSLSANQSTKLFIHQSTALSNQSPERKQKYGRSMEIAAALGSGLIANVLPTQFRTFKCRKAICSHSLRLGCDVRKHALVESELADFKPKKSAIPLENYPVRKVDCCSDKRKPFYLFRCQ